MKYLKFSLTACVLLMFAGVLSAQSCSGEKTAEAASGASKAKASATAVIPTDSNSDFTVATFKVLGNCGMCKRTIETAASSVAGVAFADWDQGTKIITVSFDADATTILAVHQKIAAAGYDTENIQADDEVYDSLHFCCQYDRVRM